MAEERKDAGEKADDVYRKDEWTECPGDCAYCTDPFYGHPKPHPTQKRKSELSGKVTRSSQKVSGMANNTILAYRLTRENFGFPGLWNMDTGTVPQEYKIKCLAYGTDDSLSDELKTLLKKKVGKIVG